MKGKLIANRGLESDTPAIKLFPHHKLHNLPH